MCRSRLGPKERIGQPDAGLSRHAVRDDPQEPLSPYPLSEEAGHILRVIRYATMLEPGEDRICALRHSAKPCTFVPAMDVHALQAEWRSW